MKGAALFCFFILFFAPMGAHSITLDEYFQTAEKAGYTEREALFLFDDIWEAEDGQVWVELGGEEINLETLMSDPEKAGKQSKRKWKRRRKKTKRGPASWGRKSGPSRKTKKRKQQGQASWTRSKTRR